MRRLFWHWAISAVALLLAAAALPGVHISEWYHALWLAPLLGLINALVGWIAGIISWIALPVNVLTLGCFGFIVAFLLYSAAIYYLGVNVAGVFNVDSLWWAAALAAVMALFGWLLNIVLPTRRARRK